MAEWERYWNISKDKSDIDICELLLKEEEEKRSVFESINKTTFINNENIWRRVSFLSLSIATNDDGNNNEDDNNVMERTTKRKYIKNILRKILMKVLSKNLKNSRKRMQATTYTYYNN